MRRVLRRAVSEPGNRALVALVALLYLLAFQVALGDLTVDAAARPASISVVPDWTALVLRERTPFQFEAVAVVEMPFVVWLVAPLNVAIGLALGLLTAVQIALVRIARRCASACGLSPAAGVLAGLPGLLAGSACCAPLLFLLLGLQVTASLVTLMGLLIPAAFLFLVIGLVLTLRVAARHCRAVVA